MIEDHDLMEDNKLIFYQENQGVCYWAIDLADMAKDNPPIWQGQSIEGQDELEWFPDSEHLSDFLLIMLCWQSVMGGLPFTANADNIDKGFIQTVIDNFSKIEIGTNYSGLEVFLEDGKVICLSKTDETAIIYAGVSDQDRFLEIENLLQIE